MKRSTLVQGHAMPNIHRVSKKLCIFAARCYNTSAACHPSLRPCAVAWTWEYIISAELSLDRHYVRRQFGVLLLATTASTSSPMSRRRIGSHGSRLCYVQGRLLQSAVGRSTKVCYRQVAAGHERCSASCERHEEVRPRLDTPASL